MSKAGYFTTGELAKLFRINKQTLIFYDKEGIFCPSYVAENGYRYYSYSHFYTVIDPETLLEKDLKDAYTDSAGTFLSICDDHGYDNVLAMCHALIRYAKENRLTLDDSLYEDVLLDEMSVEGQNHYLVKVSARLVP